ncbi:hypothetical protein TTHERM_00348680 (macronuclear) [Tetrahymena thermophila SB210]|uniref:Uncharacterized protein n=1 Tax=Tetrahymena thermophila (strain SB210) TaxID=312017 RepID=I7M9T5_TETTS|nr:hypothetical protein TTHERM_00348680 [Tetrahymena thermophila SB210]EAS02778.2 hypothetical protein TTHERM_00348680 [Tetrahymena thermophila SB210]|eukprot:XP_001023023.2 hypothetical protein TTHERM_00348680 [Tetrahymena thermophila SB210]
MGDKSKNNKKQMITSRILMKDYLFSYEDYDNLYTQLQSQISKKFKLPEKIEENSEKAKFDQFFQMLRKKRNTMVMDLVRTFLEEKATLINKKSKKEALEDIDIDLDDDDENSEEQDEDKQLDIVAEKNVMKLTGAASKKTIYKSKYLKKKNQTLKNMLKQVVDDDFSEEKVTGKQSDKDSYRKNFLDFEQNMFDESISNYDEIQIPNCFNNGNKRLIGLNINSNQYDNPNSADKSQQLNKNIKHPQGNNCNDYLSRFYKRYNQNEAIFFQILENESKLTHNMEERIVSNSGNDRELQQCSICLQLPIVPLKCQNCTQMVCAKCAFEWIQKKNECPQGCSGEWKLSKPSETELDKIVLQQYFYCQFKQFGCFQTFKILDLISHESVCSYKAIPCKFCRNQVMQYQMDDHEKKCEYRVCKCKKCSFNYVAREKKTHNCLKTVLGHYSDLKKEFKKYQLDTEEKLFNFEKQLNELMEKNKGKLGRGYPYSDYTSSKKFFGFLNGQQEQQKQQQQQQQVLIQPSQNYSLNQPVLPSNPIQNKNLMKMPNKPMLNYISQYPSFMNANQSNTSSNNTLNFKPMKAVNTQNSQPPIPYINNDLNKTEKIPNLIEKEQEKIKISNNQGFLNLNIPSSSQSQSKILFQNQTNDNIQDRSNQSNLNYPMYLKLPQFSNQQMQINQPLFKLNQENSTNPPVKPQDQNSNSINSNESNNQFNNQFDMPIDQFYDFQNTYSPDYFF